MAKWLQLPSEPMRYQKNQVDFLNCLKQRICRQCGQSFEIDPPAIVVCPTCHVKGMRVWDRLLLIAGRRWGKSRIGSIGAAFEAMVPNSTVWCCAPTNPKLHRYVIPAIQQLIPEEFVKDWNVEYKDLRLTNGSLIHFQTLEDPDQGRGQGLDALWIDEVCELTKAHWEVIRPSLAGDTAAFFTTSPRGYDWVYKELFRPAADGVPGHWACHAPTSSSANPRISPEFLARERAQMSDLMYRQEYEADFVTFQGAVYGNLVDMHVLKNETDIKILIPEWPQIDPWRPCTIGIDTGADHPFGAVKIIQCERGLVVVGDYLERNRSFYQHAMELKKLAANSSNVKYAINKNEKQQSIELAQHGIYPQKSENDIVAGTERVKSWLQAHQLWFVEPNVTRTVQQMNAYRWSDPPDDGKEKRLKEKVFKLEDELPDCIRYALMSWPVLPKAPPEEVPQARDLKGFHPEIKVSIERMRRIDREPTIKQQDVVGDFWA